MFHQPSDAFIAAQVQHALEQDVAQGDVTANLLLARQRITARIVTRQDMLLSGQAWVDAVFKQIGRPKNFATLFAEANFAPKTAQNSFVDSSVVLKWYYNDGQTLKAGDTICQLKGSARTLVTGERCALNFLQCLSGTATITHRYAQALRGTGARLLDTRKTIPGLRSEQKYAVRCGGGNNHRFGLYDAFLIKENHMIAHGSIAGAISEAHRQQPNKPIIIEVENLSQCKQVLATQCISIKGSRILLDNFSLPKLKEAVQIVNGRIALEASGGIHLDNIRAIAQTGVDFVSVGAITKNITAIDVSMRFDT